MTVYWPDNAKETFGHEILRADHPFDQSELFTDEGLAGLLDQFPRQDLNIWTQGKTRNGRVAALRGRAPRMAGKEIMDAVKHGRIWLNLSRAHLELPQLKPIADQIFESLEQATGRRFSDCELGLMISSPNVELRYDLDLSMMAMFQVRGARRLWLYPNGAEFVPPEFVEQVVHKTRSNDLPYRDEFDADARVFDLKPSMGMTWPHLAPHRLQNQNCVNVSLSCAYMTTASAINVNAIYTNSFLREKFRLSPKATNGIGPAALSKAAFAQLHKAVSPHPDTSANMPVTFELDSSAKNCVKPLW